MKRRVSRTVLPPAYLNLTSLLDITFVLLISFMVVAPAMRYSVDLQLPKVREAQQSTAKKPLAIGVISKSGTVTYYVDGKAVDLEDVADQVRANSKYSADLPVALEADKSVPWEDMARLINHLKVNAIQNIGIITERRDT